MMISFILISAMANTPLLLYIAYKLDKDIKLLGTKVNELADNMHGKGSPALL